MAKLSEKMQRTLDSIMWRVDNARNHSYEEWLGGIGDDSFMRTEYMNNKCGIVYGWFDGRSLAALERRGILFYWDDMERDAYCVMINETEK